MFELVGSFSYLRKMTEKWGEVQRKLDLANIRVSEEFESSEFESSEFKSSEFELSGFFCTTKSQGEKILN